MRSRAAVVQQAAVRAIKTAFPIIAILTVWYALALALLNFMQALGHRFGTVASGVERVTHFAMWDGPAVVPTLLGVFMVILAYELWMRKRAALVVFCGFLVAQAAVDSVRGMSRGALVITVLIAMLLALAIKQFPGAPNAESLKKLKVSIPAFAGAFFAIGILGLYFQKAYFGLRGASVYALGSKAVAIAVGDSGLRFTGWHIIFRVSLSAIAVCGIVYVLYQLFRPYRELEGLSRDAQLRARDLVENFGTDSLSYFNTRNDKNKFFYGDSAFLAYKVVGDVAVISGDPVGPIAEIPEIIDAFRAYCLDRGWRFTFLGASGTLMSLYEDAGLRAFSLGDETIVSVESFTLEGRDVRKLRQSVNKLSKAGYRMEFMFTASIPAHMKHDLVRISTDWRGGKQETGFSMGLGRLMSAEDPDCLLSVAYGPDGEPVGFLHFVPMYPHGGYSLDVHRSKIDAPGALSEFMIAQTALFLKAEGYRQMSLHFLAFAEHYREDSTVKGSIFWRRVATTLDHILPIVSVYHFDKKFNPSWKKRYLLYEGIADLLVVGFAAISAESAFGITKPTHRK
ncbi:MAG: bifunctional lysylphosphatidylglycerol flippase/synthetase MprF [Candidatus Geothermincolia bacterium]